jgi:hypothetical protein|tara:strand:- start:422 stop:610 length:189 start_codon:yes stop_codon:yes gene_type:complete
MVFEPVKCLFKLITMKKLNYFIPTKQGIIIGAAVGIATKNIVVGIVLILIFSLKSNLNLIKQ